MISVMNFQEAPGLEISMSYIYVVLPVSSVLMFLYLIRNRLRIIKGVENESDSSTAH